MVARIDRVATAFRRSRGGSMTTQARATGSSAVTRPLAGRSRLLDPALAPVADVGLAIGDDQDLLPPQLFAQERAGRASGVHRPSSRICRSPSSSFNKARRYPARPFACPTTPSVPSSPAADLDPQASPAVRRPSSAATTARSERSRSTRRSRSRRKIEEVPARRFAASLHEADELHEDQSHSRLPGELSTRDVHLDT